MNKTLYVRLVPALPCCVRVFRILIIRSIRMQFFLHYIVKLKITLIVETDLCSIFNIYR